MGRRLACDLHGCERVQLRHQGAQLLGYQFEAADSEWTDAVLGVAIDLAELYVGLGYGVIGIVVGTIFNPLDTVTNLFGMVVLSVEAIAVGLWNTVADLLSLVTLGWAQVQTANW